MVSWFLLKGYNVVYKTRDQLSRSSSQGRFQEVCTTLASASGLQGRVVSLSRNFVNGSEFAEELKSHARFELAQTTSN
jgi:hypothetical protein